MFCSQCGNKLDEGARFCSKCGARVGGGTSADGSVSTNDTKELVKALGNNAVSAAGGLLGKIKKSANGVSSRIMEAQSGTGESEEFNATGVDFNGSKEDIIEKGLCNRVVSKMYVQNGSCLLTNKRFIYCKHSLAKMAVMGVWVNLTEGSYEFDITPDQIVEIKDGKQGISKTFVFVLNDGTEYSFYMTRRQEWIIHFTNWLGVDKVHSVA